MNLYIIYFISVLAIIQFSQEKNVDFNKLNKNAFAGGYMRKENKNTDLNKKQLKGDLVKNKNVKKNNAELEIKHNLSKQQIIKICDKHIRGKLNRNNDKINKYVETLCNNQEIETPDEPDCDVKFGSFCLDDLIEKFVDLFMKNPENIMEKLESIKNIVTCENGQFTKPNILHGINMFANIWKKKHRKSNGCKNKNKAEGKFNGNYKDYRMKKFGKNGDYQHYGHKFNNKNSQVQNGNQMNNGWWGKGKNKFNKFVNNNQQYGSKNKNKWWGKKLNSDKNMKNGWFGNGMNNKDDDDDKMKNKWFANGMNKFNEYDGDDNNKHHEFENSSENSKFNGQFNNKQVDYQKNWFQGWNSKQPNGNN